MAIVDTAVTRIDLLRHGECQGGEIFRGTTDSALTEKGWQQMNAATAGGTWQRVICSPLQRCHHFAEQLSSRLGIGCDINQQLREIDFGSWEGRLIADVWQQEASLIGRYFAAPGSVTPSEGEPLADASQRVTNAWQQLVVDHRGSELLLVAHGGTIRLLLAHLLSMPLKALARLSVPHGSLTRVEIYHQADGDYPSLVSHNPAGVA